MTNAFATRTTALTLLFAGTTLLQAEENRFGPPQKLKLDDSKTLEGPELVDFDGDGKVDILSGVYSGNLLFRKNTGTAEAPTFADAVTLQNGGKDIKLKHW